MYPFVKMLNVYSFMTDNNTCQSKHVAIYKANIFMMKDSTC
jgi:hypothetical protein